MTDNRKIKDSSTPPALRGSFRRAHGHVPYDRRDILEIGGNDANDKKEDHAITDKDKPYDSRMISFDYILRTGRIPVHGDYANSTPVNPAEYNIDWKSKDEYTDAIKTLEDLVADRISENEKLQKLLKKENWNEQDRETWEREVSKIVAQDIHGSIPGLGNYRTLPHPNVPDAKKSETNSPRLNDISSDIKNDTEKETFNCVGQSVLMGILMQKMDKRFLPPAENVAPGNMRHAANYYLAVGRVTYGQESDKMGGHAFVVSPITGNIIEGTSNPWDNDVRRRQEPYKETPDGYTFMDFLKGKPAYIDKNEDVYGQNYSEATVRVVRASEGRYTANDVHKMVEKMTASAEQNGRMPDDVPPEMQKIILISKEYRGLYEDLQKAGSDEEKAALVKRLGVLHSEYAKEMDQLTSNPEAMKKMLEMLDKKAEAEQKAKPPAPAENSEPEKKQEQPQAQQPAPAT